MWGIHRTSATRFARRADRGLLNQTQHHSHLRRLSIEPLEDRALLSATIWTVNSLGDSGTGSGNLGDLRYVITQADQTTGDNTINFSVTGTITLNSALPDLRNTTGLMDIEGPGASSLTVARSSASGTPKFRVFKVNAGVQVKLEGLTISGGSADSGGGIDNEGTLTLADGVISGNSAYSGGGIANAGTMSVTDTNISANSASGTSTQDGGARPSGGGIFNSGQASVADCVISTNSANEGIYWSQYLWQWMGASGGGVSNSGQMTIASSSIANNSASSGGRGATGGGVENIGALTITTSSISGNSTSTGWYSGSSALGGGIASSGSLQLTDSTIQGNRVTGGDGSVSLQSTGASAWGGGLYLAGGVVSVMNVAVSDNSVVAGSVLADFDGLEGPPVPSSGEALGGGICVVDATVTISGATVSGNNAQGGDGGLSGSYSGWPSYLSESLGGAGGEADGGGLFLGGSASTLVLVNSTIAENQTAGGDGGIGWFPPSVFGPPPETAVLWGDVVDGSGGASFGGGIGTAAGSGAMTLVNDTVSGNSTTGGTGGGYWDVYFDPISNQFYAVGWGDSQASSYGGGLGVSSGAATLYNTIVALNSTDVGLGSGTLSSASANNLIGTGGSGGLVAGVNGNEVAVDPTLGPLQDNGGPTQTMALLPGSPAINAGSNALAVDPSTGQPLTTDQRGIGYARIVGGTVDIGAYERRSEIEGTVTVCWRSQVATLQTASDGLRLLPAGRNTDLPWLGIDQIQITLSQGATLATGDITVIGSSGTNYGPVTVSGSGTSYTITFSPINGPDQVTITIGNATIATFTRRLDVLPGDVNDDGVVNAQDMVLVRNQILRYMGALPTIFGDINGDGKVDMSDYLAVRKLIGTHW
jgi:Dockerin type I domain